MDDLISRQEAIYALQKEINKGIPPFDDVMGSIRCGVRLARNIIEDLPSAQPEIIRCKDCYWWNDEKIGWNNCGRCAEWSDVEVGMSRYTKPEDYCSYGERRSDERR